MREPYTFRELYLRFRDSLTIKVEDLKAAVSSEELKYHTDIPDRFCRAAVSCLESASKSGANNIRNTFLKDNSSSYKNALRGFFTQLQLSARTDWNSVPDKKYESIAAFFGHQAETAPTAGGGDYNILVLKKLLHGWWNEVKDTFPDDQSAWENWFYVTLPAFGIGVEFSECAKQDGLDKCGGEVAQLATPKIEEGIELIAILQIKDEIVSRKFGDIPSRDYLLDTIIGDPYFHTETASFMTEELATEILTKGFPSAQWEVACAAAGLVEFKWVRRGQR